MASAGASPRVLVTLSDFPQEALDLLKTKCDVTVMNCNGRPPVEKILKLLPEHDALLANINIDKKFLDAAGSKLKIISTPIAGHDHMDIVEIKKRGIKVGNAPLVSDAVAEVAVFLLLGAARRVHDGQQLLEQGRIRFGFFQRSLGFDLRNKTIGIVGLGNIGIAIVERLKSFKIKKFLYAGHFRKKAGDELGAEFVSLDELLKQSDFVINSASLNAETEKMFNEDAFEKMKKTAVFINVGRGKSVDTDALVEALKNKTIFAAGLGVTDPEPLPTTHELLKLPNAMIIPHMGTQTIETRTDMAMAAVQNIICYFEGKPLPYEL